MRKYHIRTTIASTAACRALTAGSMRGLAGAVRVVAMALLAPFAKLALLTARAWDTRLECAGQ
jgi:hypothetical protein